MVEEELDEVGVDDEIEDIVDEEVDVSHTGTTCGDASSRALKGRIRTPTVTRSGILKKDDRGRGKRRRVERGPVKF